MMASMKKIYLSVVSVIYRAKHVQKVMKTVVRNVKQIEQVVFLTYATVLWVIMMTKHQIVINAISPV
jgi:hypothetical protein